jgi:hypothetical protein
MKGRAPRQLYDVASRPARSAAEAARRQPVMGDVAALVALSVMGDVVAYVNLL